MRAALCVIAVVALAACAAARPPSPRFTPHAAPAHAAEPPHVMIDPATGEHSLTLRVMTWNVAGLPAPLKSGRAAALARIGDALAAMRARGDAPDVVLIQEGFMDGPMRDLVRRAGYAYVARGPDAGASAPQRDAALGDPWRLRGEGLVKLFGSGLYILSDYPVLESGGAAFGDCAGLDCLANKGVMLARIAVPGAPAPVAVLNTHLNSRRSAKTPEPRANLAHRLQVDALEAFVQESGAGGDLLLFGGDFNMRDSEERWDYAAPAGPYAFARAWCAADAGCDRSALPATEADMHATQDLQGFHDGAALRARPVRLAVMADRAAPDALSDHSAYLVEYRLSWDGAPARQAVAARPAPYAGLFVRETAAPAQTAALDAAAR